MTQIRRNGDESRLRRRTPRRRPIIRNRFCCVLSFLVLVNILELLSLFLSNTEELSLLNSVQTLVSYSFLSTETVPSSDSQRRYFVMEKSKRTNVKNTIIRHQDFEESTILLPNNSSSTDDKTSPASVSTGDTHHNNNNSNATRNSPDYYMVFSTSCSAQQHWQSYVFFYHANKVQQPGSVTRIASGCSETEAFELTAFHSKYISPMGNFHLHLTPSYSNIRKWEGGSYKYFNKPFGLQHWIQNGLGMNNKTIFDDSSSFFKNAIVMILDPDMILLRPMVHDFAQEEVQFVEFPPETKTVRHHYPMAQQDGYLYNSWMTLNLSYITGGELSSFTAKSEGPRFWNAGPPYLLTMNDMYHLVNRWCLYVPKTFDVYPHLFAEMYGLVIAAVTLELPFTLIKSLVVSDTETRAREGWDYVDQLSEKHACNPPVNADLPVGLHYCQVYPLGKHFFSKYRVKKSMFHCETPLILLPPDDILARYNYSVLPPRADLRDKDTYVPQPRLLNPKIAKRNAFMLCHLTRAVNDAFRYFKLQACGETANLNETWDIHTDPRD